MSTSARRAHKRKAVRQAEKRGHTKWETMYGMMGAKLIRSGKFNTIANVMSVAKFLAAPLYVFSLFYDPIKTRKMKRKLAKINSRTKDKNL